MKMIRCPKMKIRVFFPAILLLSLVACSPRDQLEDLQAPVLPESSLLGELDLTDGPSSIPPSLPHEVLEVWEVTASQTVKTGFQDKVPLEISSTQSFILTRTEEPDKDGRRKISLKISGLKIKNQDTWQATHSQKDLSSREFGITAVVNDQGGIESLRFPAGADLPPYTTGLFEALLTQTSAQLPDAPLARDKPWESTLDIPITHRDNNTDLKISLKSSYLGETSRKGLCTRCVVVDTRGNIEEKGKIDRKPVSGAVSGAGHIRKVALVDVSSGKLVEAEILGSHRTRLIYGGTKDRGMLSQVQDYEYQARLRAVPHMPGQEQESR